MLYSSKLEIKSLKISLTYEINKNKQLEVTIKDLKLPIIKSETKVNDSNKTIDIFVGATKPVANKLIKVNEKEAYRSI